MRSTLRLLLGLLALTTLLPVTAQAGPVASSSESYQVLGRVFPDPQGPCGQAGSQGAPCSPLAQGNMPATTFLGYLELIDGLTFMNSQQDWQRYMEVWTLDGDLGGNEDNDPGTDEKANFPGNNLGFWEFKPDGRAHSAGLPVSNPADISQDDGRVKSDVIVVRVTDEAVPDAGKKRYALSLSIHGIERAGVEGGVRALEDLATAVTSDRLDKPVVTTEDLGLRVPTFKEVLQKTIIYFTFPNPDGWRRGDVNDPEKGPGGLFQRYNGNGVDLNRDFPDIGFSFRPYSGLSEPESRGWANAFRQIKSDFGPFAAGDDLHGMNGADAFSFTLLPHGSHDYAKNERIRTAAQAINLVQQDALSWSPLIQPNDAPDPQCAPSPLGEDCPQMYGQTWGTVFDTIDYTTTGTLGDWMDSSIGLAGDGIDNEMAYSHLTKNITFDPLIEQMHVDGNKGLIYAHLAQMLNPTTYVFPSRGRKGYVRNSRITRAAKDLPAIPAGTKAQDAIQTTATAEPNESDVTRAVHEFDVLEGNGIYSGGMRVDVNSVNIQGINPTAAALTKLYVECSGCDRHRGVKNDDEWVVVAEDYNQSGLYLQAGLTAAVNIPQAGRWRVRVAGTPPGPVNIKIEFTQEPATSDGATGGDDPPRLAAYDVASSDFWKKLEPFTVAGAGFQGIDADGLAAGSATVPDSLDTLILSDEVLPGYAFPALATTKAPDPVEFVQDSPTLPCGYADGQPHTPTCANTFDFDVTSGELGRATVTVVPTSVGDFTLTLYKLGADGSEQKLGETVDGGSFGDSESTSIAFPEVGKYRAYVDNWAGPPGGGPAPAWEATVSFEVPDVGPTGGASRYSDAQYAAYAAKLKAFVQDGGNLLLTDGALRALPALFPAIERKHVARNIVYVGQVAFTKEPTDEQNPDVEGNTLADPLARGVNIQGARFKSGLRRQTFEPTPVGFSIQDAEGDDADFSPQWIVDRGAFEKAGGRIVATGSSGEAAATNLVTVGEIPMGKGVVRVIGALLPQPTQAYDHQEGLEPFAVTYTGYRLAENLTDWCRPGRNCVDPRIAAAGGGGLGGAGSAATSCFAKRAFKFAAAKGRGKGLKFGFRTNVDEPVRVDLFQVADRFNGRWRVLKERLIGRFTERKSFTWNGRRTTRFAPSDGFYFARFEVRSSAGFADVKRIALRRKNGKWYRQLGYYGRGTCGLLRQAKLRRMVFGGQDDTPMGASYLLARRAQMKITVSKGKKVVARYSKKRAKGRKVVFWWVPRKATKAPGLYTVRFKAGKGKGAMRDTLYARKLPKR